MRFEFNPTALPPRLPPERKQIISSLCNEAMEIASLPAQDKYDSWYKDQLYHCAEIFYLAAEDPTGDNEQKSISDAANFVFEMVSSNSDRAIGRYFETREGFSKLIGAANDLLKLSFN